MKLKLICIFSFVSFVFHHCTKDKSPLPISNNQGNNNGNPVPVINKDSLAQVDYNKYLLRILDFSCTGCHDGGEFGGPGPGDFRTFSKFKVTVLKSGNPMRNRGLTDMSACNGSYGCLTALQKDSLSNWLKGYYNL